MTAVESVKVETKRAKFAAGSSGGVGELILERELPNITFFRKALEPLCIAVIFPAAGLSRLVPEFSPRWAIVTIGIKFCILFQDYTLYKLILELRRDCNILVCRNPVIGNVSRQSAPSKRRSTVTPC